MTEEVTDTKLDDLENEDSQDTQLSPDQHEGALRDRRVAGMSAVRDTSTPSERTVVEPSVQERDKPQLS